MKQRLTFLSLMLCMFWGLQAQELTVKSMEPAEMDLSASTHQRKDNNGKACALIKVQLATMGAKFEGNVIGPVENKAGEYWVYMSEGSYMLKVKHPNFIPLMVNFRDYGIRSVQPKTTYVLTLLFPQGAAQPIDDGKQYLMMTVTPSNSKVMIDNQEYGLTEGQLSVRLGKGTHNYTVEAYSYATQKGIITLGDNRESVVINLKSVMASVNVSCATPGATIYINDLAKGLAPWTGKLAKGDYIIEARKDGHLTNRQNISLDWNENKQVSFPALQAIVGNIDVNYLPLNSEVWIDNKKAGVSPNIFRNIPIGKHQVELRAQGYETVRKTVYVQEGQTASISGQMNLQNASSIRQQQTIQAHTDNNASNLDKTYCKPSQLYIQAGVQLGKMTGFGLCVGGYISNVNIEAYATRAIGTETLFINPIGRLEGGNTEEDLTGMMYGGKLGYSIKLGSRMRMVPQAGIGMLSVNGDNVTVTALCATVGWRTEYAISRNIGISLTPEAQFALSKGEGFDNISSISSKIKGWGTGANLRLGLFFNF